MGAQRAVEHKMLIPPYSSILARWTSEEKTLWRKSKGEQASPFASAELNYQRKVGLALFKAKTKLCIRTSTALHVSFPTGRPEEWSEQRLFYFYYDYFIGNHRQKWPPKNGWATGNWPKMVSSAGPYNQVEATLPTTSRRGKSNKMPQPLEPACVTTA